MTTLFSKIIAGEIPSVFVWSDDICVAFMSINPMATGHTLVVPRAEVDHWITLPIEVNGHLMRVSQIIGQAQQEAFACERIGLIVAGYEIPHVHIHVIPTTDMGQLSFAAAATSISREELEAAASRIRLQLTALGRTEVFG